MADVESEDQTSSNSRDDAGANHERHEVAYGADEGAGHDGAECDDDDHGEVSDAGYHLEVDREAVEQDEEVAAKAEGENHTNIVCALFDEAEWNHGTLTIEPL